MMKIKWLAVIAIIVALAFVPTIGHAAPSAQVDAAALFQQRCAPCHGANGEGTQQAPPLTQLKQTDQELFQIISEGKAGTNMQAWKTTLSTDEIDALVPYLRTLGSPATKLPAPPSPVVATNPEPQPKLAVALEITPSTAGVVFVRATVRDDKGQPVYNVPVAFNLITALGGRLQVGAMKTDTLGSALIEYTAGEGREITLEATAGQGVPATMASATATTPGGVDWSPAPLIAPNPPGAEIMVLLVIFGGVWLTYAFIGRQLIGILREE